MKERTGFGLPIAVIVLAMLVLGYVAAYLSLVNRKFEPHTGTAWVRYRYGDDISRTVFRPIHRIVRWLRPDYWPDGDWTFLE